MPALILTDSQEVDLFAEPQDKHGHPADLDSPATWSSSDESIITVVGSADGKSAVAKAAGNIGSAQVSVNGVENGQNLPTGVFAIEVKGGDAVGFNVTAGTPREQTDTGGGGGETPVEPPPTEIAPTPTP